MQFYLRKLEISAFHTALISHFHIVTEVNALEIASISSLLEENGTFPNSRLPQNVSYCSITIQMLFLIAFG